MSVSAGSVSGDLDGDALTIRNDQLAEWGEADWSILDDRRGALPEFPSEVLPPELREYIDYAAMGAGVTSAHVTVPLLSISSGIIGTARRVKPSRGWSEPLSIWSALVGFSGTGKTPGIGVTKRAVTEIERNRKEKLSALQREHETRSEAAKAAHKKWLKEVEEATAAGLPPPAMPASALKVGSFVTPRLYVTDSTIERIAVLLEARPAGLQVIADELAGLFANMARYSSGSDREFWLEAWNGRSHTVERMGRPPVNLDHLLVGITGGLQPDKLVRAFEGDDDGMYARICFAWPSEPGYRPLSNEVSEVEPELINALEKLTRLGDPDSDGILTPHTIPLSFSAVERFETFRFFLHDEKDRLDGREREWWAKGATQVLRLAGTLAFLSWAWADHRSEPNEIDEKSVDAAIAIWRDYFWPHSNAALRQIGVSRSHSNARRALRWIRANQKVDISLLDIRRDALGQRLDAQQTEAVMESLARANWIKRHTHRTGGAAIPAVVGKPSIALGCRKCRKCRKWLSIHPFCSFCTFCIGPRLTGSAALSRQTLVPPGSWPRRMSAELAAAYCGESSVGAFVQRVGTEYPLPRVCEGRRRLWLKDDLDAAILPPEMTRAVDVAEDL